jgi:hypothetical protein
MALGALNGTSSAFFFPAAAGIVPQTVPKPMLQSANAILRLGTNGSWIVGAALGGLIVAATSPGVGIAADAATYLLAALFTALIRLPKELRMEATNFFAELKDGWLEFRSRTWLWVIVLQFGFVNAFELGTQGVLGPAIAKDHLGGATAWGLILTADALGLIAGGCGRPGLRAFRDEADDPRRGRDQPDRDAGRTLRPRRADDFSSVAFIAWVERPAFLLTHRPPTARSSCGCVERTTCH